MLYRVSNLDSLDERPTLGDLREVRWSGMEWIDLTQDRDQWRAPVITVMDFWIPQNVGEILE
jgi:hypothetical protein